MKVKKIIKCSAEWCAPCRNFAKTFEKVSKYPEFHDIEFKAIDIEKDDEGKTIVDEHHIKSIPTTILLSDNNEVIYKLLGDVMEQDFANTIRKCK